MDSEPKKLTLREALSIAIRNADKGLTALEADVVELVNGWFFPWTVTDGQTRFGSPGVIVNKQSGECFHVAHDVDSDLQGYVAGYTLREADVKISKVRELESTLDMLESLRISVVEPEFAHGTLWKIPRELSRDELQTMLSKLPCTFPNGYVYPVIETLENARANGWCDFELTKPEKALIENSHR